MRDDAGSWDIGYPRVWEAAPGKIGAVYRIETLTRGPRRSGK